MVDNANSQNYQGSHEFRMYKAVFATLNALHFQEYRNLASHINQTLTDYHSNQLITIALQEKIRALKTSINSKSLKVDSFILAYSELMERHHDIGLMSLTLFQEKPQLYE